MSEEHLPKPPRHLAIGRRRALLGLSAAGLALSACRTQPPGVASMGFASASPAASSPAASPLPRDKACVLTPQADEGPFYFDPRLLRADITEGKPGVPLRLRFQLLDAATCSAVPGARMDVWHADATGHYSGYDDQGDETKISTKGLNFLRGTQFSDAAGDVDFATIYPGWYTGRTTHIHFKVFLDQRNVLTGQLYFPDALSEYLYKNVAPYKERQRERDTLNTTDGVLRASGNGREAFCSIKEERDHYLATLVVGVDRNAIVSRESAPRFGPPPGGLGPPPGSSRGPRQGSLVPGVV